MSPPDRPVQLQATRYSRPGPPAPATPHPDLELLEQLGVAGRLRQQPAHTHSHRPAGHGGGPGCTTPRPAWLSHTSRELIFPAARTYSSTRSPTPDPALLLARTSAVLADFWLAWPLTTATGP